MVASLVLRRRKTRTLLRIGTSKQEGFSIATSVGAFGRMNYNSFTRSNMLKVDEKGELHRFLSKLGIKRRRIEFKGHLSQRRQMARWHNSHEEDIEFSFDFLSMC